MNIDGYILRRVDDQIKWHDEKAQKCQRVYKFLQTVQLIFSACLPLLSGCLSNWNFMPLSTGLIGVIITIITGILTLNRYHENWIEYRATCEMLKREKYLYEMKAPPYGNEGTPEELFTVNIEAILSSENNNWKTATSAVPTAAAHSSKGS